MIHMTKRAAHAMGHRGRCNSKDRKKKHPIITKLIIIMMYLMSAIDMVCTAVDSLIMCCLKMVLCGQNI
jgi:hypothetical protein